MITPLRGYACTLAVLSCLAGLAEGRADNPLDRNVPVRAAEQIPIVDFFRPSTFRSPQLNDAGTKFAAMITVGAVREELLVYDFAKAAGDRLRGIGKQDIYDFDWLDSRDSEEIGFQLRWLDDAAAECRVDGYIESAEAYEEVLEVIQIESQLARRTL